MTELSLTIPMEPPSGNHYKSFRVIGKHASWYLTKEAKSWITEIALASFQAVGCYTADGSCDCRQVSGKAHEVTYAVYQGSGSRGDVDNYAKVILDGLVKAGVLKSDASVVAMHAYKFRDRENPRTEITVRAI